MITAEDEKHEEQNDEALSAFKVNDFEGPLDLLLFLIKKNEINIYDIPISDITEQYLEYLDYAVSLNLDSLTEFYELAAHLIYIKSKMLLPVEVDLDNEDIEDPRMELVNKLIEYQKFKKLSVLMEKKKVKPNGFLSARKYSMPFPLPKRICGSGLIRGSFYGRSQN